MQINADAMQAGLSGIQSGLQRIEQAGSAIAGNSLPSAGQADTPAPDRDSASEAMVALRVGQYEAELATKVIKTADEVLGTLIDTRA